MKKHPSKQNYYFATALLLSVALSPIGTVALAADVTTPITIDANTSKTINDNVHITDLGSSKYAIGTSSSSGINNPTSITFNANVTLDITKPLVTGALINVPNYISSPGFFNININGAEFNINAKTANAGTFDDKFAAVSIDNNVDLNVSAKTTINITATDTSISYATTGRGMATFNNDLTINMNGGKTVYGLNSVYTLNGAKNDISITSNNSKAIGGLYNISSNTDAKRSTIGSNTITNINIIDTGTATTQATGIGGTVLTIDRNAILNINVDSQAHGVTELSRYLGMENGTNGIMLQGKNGQSSTVAQGAQINIVLKGSAVDITPGQAPDNNIYYNTGLDGATGISSSIKSTIDGDVNVQILSPKGVGIKAIIYNPDARALNVGQMSFNGNTIINAQGGYALLSATSSTGYRDNFADPQSWRTTSTITINQNGGSLVQLTGDIDHMGLSNSIFDINMDTSESFLRGSALLSNIRQYHIEWGPNPTADGNKTNITLANGATWYMTGKSDINLTGNSIVNQLKFAHQGLLDMTASDTPIGYTYEQLNINDLAGTDGKILMNTNLQQSFDNKNVKADSDRIYIEKYSNQYEIDHPDNPYNLTLIKVESPLSAGIHTIDIKDTSLLSKKLSEGYLLLVEDHTQGNAQFIGGQLQKGGIFKYKPIITDEDPLDYIGVPTDSNNWYLTGFEKIGIDEEAFLNAGLAESRYISYMNEQDTLIKRLGELRQHDQEKGLWVRMRGANNSVDGFGINRNSYVSTHLGYDWKLQEKEQSKAKRYMGIAFNHTNNNFDYAFGATGKGQSNVLTVYGTRLGDKGHYLDLVGKIGRMSNNYKYQTQQVETSNWFYSLSAEYGRSIVRDKGWYYEPQVQFTFGHINGASYSSKESNIAADSINSAILRAGILAGRKFNEDKPEKSGSYYAKLFWSHEFGGDVKAAMTDVYGDKFDFKHSYSGSWITVGLGTSLNLNKKTNLYLDVEKAFGGKISGGWAWQGGVRWRF